MILSIFYQNENRNRNRKYEIEELLTTEALQNSRPDRGGARYCSRVRQKADTVVVPPHKKCSSVGVVLVQQHWYLVRTSTS